MSDERPDEQPADEKPGDDLPTHIQRADGLTHKQEAAIIALLNEPTVSKAAVACGLNDRTIYRWLDESAFSKAYRKARREAFAQAIADFPFASEADEAAYLSSFITLVVRTAFTGPAPLFLITANVPGAG